MTGVGPRITGFGQGQMSGGPGRPPVPFDPRPALGYLRDHIQLAPTVQELSVLSCEGIDIATKILELMKTHKDWTSLGRALNRELEEEEAEMVATEKLFAPAPPSPVCRIGAWLVKTWDGS